MITPILTFPHQGGRDLRGGDVEVEDVVVAVVPGPGEEGQDHLLGNEALSLVEALLDVVIQVHVGLEAMTGGGDAADDLVRVGELLTLGGGDGPVVGDFPGQLAEAVDGEFFGEFALEGVDLVAYLGDGHGIISFIIHEGHEGARREIFIAPAFAVILGHFRYLSGSGWELGVEN